MHHLLQSFLYFCICRIQNHENVPTLLKNWFFEIERHNLISMRQSTYIFHKNTLMFHIPNFSFLFLFELFGFILFILSATFRWVAANNETIFPLILPISRLETNYFFSETYQRDIVDFCALTMILSIYNMLCFIISVLMHTCWQNRAIPVN